MDLQCMFIDCYFINSLLIHIHIILKTLFKVNFINCYNSYNYDLLELSSGIHIESTGGIQNPLTILAFEPVNIT